jgi:hypothetical protein
VTAKQTIGQLLPREITLEIYIQIHRNPDECCRMGNRDQQRRRGGLKYTPHLACFKGPEAHLERTDEGKKIYEENESQSIENHITWSPLVFLNHENRVYFQISQDIK